MLDWTGLDGIGSTWTGSNSTGLDQSSPTPSCSELRLRLFRASRFHLGVREGARLLGRRVEFWTVWPSWSTQPSLWGNLENGILGGVQRKTCSAASSGRLKKIHGPTRFERRAHLSPGLSKGPRACRRRARAAPRKPLEHLPPRPPRRQVCEHLARKWLRMCASTLK